MDRPPEHVRSLSAAEPYAPVAALGHVVATAVPGCEEMRDGWYRRTLRLAHGPAILELHPEPTSVTCRLLGVDEDAGSGFEAARRVLDLDGSDVGTARPDPADVVRVLTGDPLLKPVVERSPGQRLPRSVDAAELAVRAVLGQQVSTAAARTLAHRLLLNHGTPLADAGWTDPAGALTHLWPDLDRLVDVDPATLAMPSSRRRTFAALVRAVADGDVTLSPGADVRRAREALAALPGVGPWTVEIIALRGLGDADAFPATDLGVRRAAAALGITSPAELLRRSERWRPYRAYAVQHLWSTLDHEVNRDWRRPAAPAASSGAA